MSVTTTRPILVVGAGIAGITATLEAAEAGQNVVLVEREASVGGRAIRNHHYFPKLCPPSCGMELNTRRLERNPRVRVITGATVTACRDVDGGREVTVSRVPAFVSDRCTLCGACSEVCPARVKDPFNLGLSEVPAIRLPHPYAWPKRFVLDRDACPAGCRKCVDACAYGAIDLDAKPVQETVGAAAVVVATGWQSYPIEKLPELGGGVLADVIANVHMERLAAASGPTGGKIVRPSDGTPPRRVVFVQCAGSRDVNHLPYCSAVCCLATLKQALYVHEQVPDAEITIFYIDRRSPGRNEDMLTRVAEVEGVHFVKGKVGSVTAGPDGTLVVKAEDVELGRIVETPADLVVLATGMVPNLKSDDTPFGLVRDEDGFGVDGTAPGVVVAGVARCPEDVAATTRDATGAAAKACMVTGRSA